MDLKCPCCEKGFSGKTAQTRLNSHCKAIHFIYYRQHIRPLKDPKLVNHDAYIRQKQKDPAKVRKDRLMARMRKKAKKEQIDCIVQGVHLAAPHAPGNTNIDPTNPFYTIEFKLRIFIGLTLRELVSFDVIPTLEKALANLVDEELQYTPSSQQAIFEETARALLEPDKDADQSQIISLPVATGLSMKHPRIRPMNLRAQVRNALAVARSAEHPNFLALTYYKYRQAIYDSEFYEERLQHYLLAHEGRLLNPERNIDHNLVEKRAAELAAECRPRNRPTTGTATMKRRGTASLPPSEDEDEDEEDEDDGDEDDGEYEEEQEHQFPLPLPEVIPDSDREYSVEL